MDLNSFFDKIERWFNTDIGSFESASTLIITMIAANLPLIFFNLPGSIIHLLSISFTVSLFLLYYFSRRVQHHQSYETSLKLKELVDMQKASLNDRLDFETLSNDNFNFLLYQYGRMMQSAPIDEELLHEIQMMNIKLTMGTDPIS
jgi:hypothetical protein